MRRSAAGTPLVLTALAASLACRSAAAPSGPGQPGSRTLSVDALREDLLVIAADSLAGRATGTRGAQVAAEYLAARLAAAGVEPAGDSGYFQRVPFVRGTYGAGTRFEVTGAGAAPLALGADLVPLPALGRNTPLPRVVAEGDVVYVGYVSGAGAVRPESIGDVAGKVLVVVNGAPPGTPAGERAALEAEGRIGPRLRELVPLNPAAIIVLAAGKSAGFVDQLAGRLTRTAASGADAEAIAVGVPDSARTLPMLLLGHVRAGSPLLPAGWPAGARVGPVDGRRFLGRVDNAFNALNVVGVVRGRDPTLAGSYVAYGAHYDHIGLSPGTGDTVNNGADDDGSGSVALLAIARRFASGERPRRSLLFVWHVGEEVGLVGSEWFTTHPTVPIDSVVAQLNADMIGRNAPDSLYVVGPSAAPNGQSRVLGAVLDSVNAASTRPFLVNREWDSPRHPEQIYFRSDHYNYARRGVPILFLTTGLHADYHQPSDEVSKIDFPKLARVATLMYDLGRVLADRPTRPR